MQSVYTTDREFAFDDAVAFEPLRRIERIYAVYQPLKQLAFE